MKKKNKSNKIIDWIKNNLWICVLLLIIIIAWIVSLINISGINSKNRIGFYYKDRYDLWNQKNWIISDPLKSYDECLSWLNQVKRRNEDYDSECWYKCKKVTWIYWDLYNCEDTKKWIGFNVEFEETQKKAAKQAEENEKQKQAEELAEAQMQAELEAQAQAYKKAQCDSLRTEAKKQIASIESQKSNVFCDNLNSQYAEIQQLESKLNNVKAEAASAFKWDVPQYLIDARASNLSQEYKQKIDSLYRSINNFSINECNQEKSYNRKFDELILEWKQTVTNNWCSF